MDTLVVFQIPCEKGLDPKRLLRRQGVPNSYTDLHRVCDWRILEDWGIIYTYMFTCIWLNYLGNVAKYGSHTLSVPRNLTWNFPKKLIFLFQNFYFRFHVTFPGSLKGDDGDQRKRVYVC